MQQTTHNLGHSKHRKAFGTKYPKSGLNRLMLQKDQDRQNDQRATMKRRKRGPMYDSIKELMGRK
jgi:hypothetical protein